MSLPLNNRADCLREIRRLVGDDAWTARYALLSALQRLDLLEVNQVLEDLEISLEGRPRGREHVLKKLLEERWGRIG